MRRSVTLIFWVVLALFLVACRSEATPTPEPTATSEPAPKATATEVTSGLSTSALANMEYQSDWTQSGTAPLENGAYSEEAAPGSATKIVVKLTNHVAFGELNGQPAAAVVLVTDPGGSGTFYSLHVVVEQNGQPVDVATTSLGDRVQVNALSIQDNQVVVDMITHGPDDPMCCPTQQVINTYELQGDQLVQTSSQVVGGAKAVLDILNVVWQWEQTVTPVHTTTIDDPSKYTLELLPDGQFRFNADCNSGSGTYAIDGSNISLELGPVTLAECGPDSLYDQYLRELGAAAVYFLQDDKLYIDLQMDSGTMRFGEALGIEPNQIRLDTQGLPYAWQPVVVLGTPYDESQPPGPKGLPKHMEVLFGVTDPADRQYGDPIMYIIPVDAYERLWETNGNDGASKVIGQIYSLAVALPQPPPTQGMPALPYEEIGGVNDLAVQIGRAVPANELNETSSAQSGYRFVGRWTQDPNPVTNQGLRYVYQGFTNNGKYLVSFWYPVSSSALPATAADVSADEMQQVTDDATGYLEAKAEELNALPTSAWEPDLATLQALVASLEIEDMPVAGIQDKIWWWTGSTASATDTQVTPVDEPSRYEVIYHSDGTIDFVADCNSGSMTYELRNGGAVGGMLAQPGPMTLAECEPGSRSDELVNALMAAQDYRVRPGGKVMQLNMPAGGGVLIFIDSGRTVTAGVEAGPTPEATRPPAPPTATAPPAAEINFWADRTTINQGECATLWWKTENVQAVWLYPQGEPYESYPEIGEGSRQVCPDTTTTYELRVQLAEWVEIEQITIEVTAQDPLANTNWQLSAMNVNQVPLPDTTITLFFGADGSLSGNGGCNDCNGGYVVSGGTLSIGPLATTMKSCGEDVDTQEQFYLAALQAARTFELTGDQLIIRDAADQEVLRYNRIG